MSIVNQKIATQVLLHVDDNNAMKRYLRAIERSVERYWSVVVFVFVVGSAKKFDKAIGCGDLDRAFHGLDFFSVAVDLKFSAKRNK